MMNSLEIIILNEGLKPWPIDRGGYSLDPGLKAGAMESEKSIINPGPEVRGY
jgi:hypothetical protein